MKAKTTIGENGLLQGALSDEDLQRVNALIENMKIQYSYRKGKPVCGSNNFNLTNWDLLN